MNGRRLDVMFYFKAADFLIWSCVILGEGVLCIEQRLGDWRMMCSVTVRIIRTNVSEIDFSRLPDDNLM